MLRMAVVLMTALSLASYASRGTRSVPEAPLTYKEALSRALAHNPQLAAAAAETRGLEAQQQAARLMTNPELILEAENFGGSGQFSGLDSAETTIAIGQQVELGGKRKTRHALVGEQITDAHLAQKLTRLEVTSTTRKAFMALLAAQRKVELHEELYILAQGVAHSVTARVDAGKEPRLEKVKAEVALANAQAQLQQTQLELAGLRAALATLWGETTADFDSVVGELDTLERPPPREVLQEDALQGPRVERWEARKNAGALALKLARASRIPDVTVEAGYRTFGESDESAWTLGLSVPLPVLNRGGAEIAHARAALDQTEALERAERIRTLADVEETRLALNIAYTQATILKEKVLPAAASAYEGTRAGYREGKFGFLEVLDAQRTYFEANIQYTDWLAQYHQHKTDLDQLTGRSIGGVQ